jgi:hypothetical protein
VVTAAIAGTANDTGSSIDVARSLSPAPAHTPGASSAIDPLSQVSAEDPARLVAPANIRRTAYFIAKEHRTIDPTTTDTDGRRPCPRQLRTLEKCRGHERGAQGEEVGACSRAGYIRGLDRLTVCDRQ